MSIAAQGLHLLQTMGPRTWLVHCALGPASLQVTGWQALPGDGPDQVHNEGEEGEGWGEEGVGVKELDGQVKPGVPVWRIFQSLFS